MLELGITFSFEQFVMDNDMVKMVNKVVKGIDINDETLAVDVIRQVGVGKDFLMQEHTMKHMRTEQSRPMLMDRKMKHAWEEAGSKNLTEVAHEKAIHILKNHKPEPLPADVASKLTSIVSAAEEEFGVTQK